MKKTTIHCDVCGEELSYLDFSFSKNGVMYRFYITTYNKDSSIGPKPLTVRADICKKCLIKALSEEKTCNS